MTAEARRGRCASELIPATLSPDIGAFRRFPIEIMACVLGKFIANDQLVCRGFREIDMQSAHSNGAFANSINSSSSFPLLPVPQLVTPLRQPYWYSSMSFLKSISVT